MATAAAVGLLLLVVSFAPDAEARTSCAYAGPPANAMTVKVDGGFGIGMIKRKGLEITGQRSAPWNVHYLSMWPDPADTEQNIAYTRGLANAMKPWTTGRAYLNFIGDEGIGRVEAAFGTEKYQRLQALKDEWDPRNLFRHNQNIPPTAG